MFEFALLMITGKMGAVGQGERCGMAKRVALRGFFDS